MARRGGVSLIELLVVLAIVGILASAVLPSYQQYLVRTRRGEAQAALLRLMLQQERYFSQTNSYLAFSSSSNGVQERRFQWWSGNSAASSAYEVEGKACDGELISQCVQLVATPGTARVDRQFRDADCQLLTLTSAGQRLASGPAPDCWR
jgi:type IV pilus assembly protein PilE